ncbi:MAG: alpha/beta hydrolase [Fimbriimonadaceae bacterium]|nr:alpha/beta hydrolase [Fimbriimonadaceae bacterium]
MLASAVFLTILQTSVIVDRGDYVIHAEKIGTGHPMVAIAGGPGFSGKSIWGIGFGMRSNVCTYLFDQLGTGKSQPKKQDSDLSTLIQLNSTVDDLEALRKSEKINKWIVCGQSWGVIVALVYAARYPDHVDQLLLTSIPGIGFDGHTLSDNLNKTIPNEVNEQILAIEIDQTLSKSQKLEQQILLLMPYYFYRPAYGEHIATLAPPKLFNADVFTSLQKHILNPEAYRNDLAKLPNLKLRATMIQGQQDPCGAAMPYLLRDKYLPGASIFLLPQTGHFPWIESLMPFFASAYEGLKIDPPSYITQYETFEEDGPSFDEKQERIKYGWPFNYTPASSN